MVVLPSSRPMILFSFDAAIVLSPSGEAILRLSAFGSEPPSARSVYRVPASFAGWVPTTAAGWGQPQPATRLEHGDIVRAQLLVEQLISNTDQRIVVEYARDQQCRGVCRGKEDGVDRRQRMNGQHGAAGTVRAGGEIDIDLMPSSLPSSAGSSGTSIPVDGSRSSQRILNEALAYVPGSTSDDSRK
jgi:hypothetical protein